jgi:checkpoint serine/threonine-protein kinase
LAFDGCKEVINGSELMLVDFGRAVDLKAAAKPEIDPMDVRLEGSCAEKDMECVAMRKGLSWSFDVDTFGVCASAHVLLYGSHIEIDCNSTTKRWKPRKPLRRYWQKDLWNDFFDTLLNLDEVSQTALGSHPRSLRALYKKMETYIRDRSRSSNLESLLKHQASMLPSVRIT